VEAPCGSCKNDTEESGLRITLARCFFLHWIARNRLVHSTFRAPMESPNRIASLSLSMKTRRLFTRAVVISALWVPWSVEAQRISVSKTVVISADAPTNAHGESFLAINPRDPNNLLAASNVVRESGTGTSAYVSRDGGQSWRRAVTSPTTMHVSDGWDVIAYFDSRGKAYWGSMYYGPYHKVNHGAGLWITRSDDGGGKWNSETLIPGTRLFDRPFMAFADTGTLAGRVYAGGVVTPTTFKPGRFPALLLAYSTDAARTFGPPHIIANTEGERISLFAGMLVTLGGTLVAPFVTETFDETRNPVPSSRDGPPVPSEWSFRLATSEDGGSSIVISPKVLTRKSPRGPGIPSSAVDRSTGEYRGRLYLLWEERTGDGVNIYVAHSTDNGNTWSQPATVNDNTIAANHANAAIAVNSEGIVGVTWNDRRAHKDKCYDLRFSASLDGGATFLPSVTPGGRSTCATSNDPFPDGGETQGLVGAPNGVFHSAWIDGSSGVKQLAATRFTVLRN
jgi:hypothetical protein